MLNCVLGIIGGVITGPTVSSQMPALLFAGRFIIGLNCGVTISLVPMYLVEISPRDVRGNVGSCHQAAVVFGIVVGNILTLDLVLNTPNLWSIAQAMTAVPAFFGFCLLPLCPESPRFLFLKLDEEGARAAFLKMTKHGNVDDFLEEMRAEMASKAGKDQFHFLDLFIKKELRLAIAIACVAQATQQLSGVNALSLTKKLEIRDSNKRSRTEMP